MPPRGSTSAAASSPAPQPLRPAASGRHVSLLVGALVLVLLFLVLGQGSASPITGLGISDMARNLLPLSGTSPEEGAEGEIVMGRSEVGTIDASSSLPKGPVSVTTAGPSAGGPPQSGGSNAHSSSNVGSGAEALGPLTWPPPAVWDEAAEKRPPPFVRADDTLEAYEPLEEREWSHPDVRLSSNSTPFAENRAAEGRHPPLPLRLPADAPLSVRYGILATASLLYSRALPLLNMSLRHADRVDVFIRRTPLSYAIVAYVKTFAARHMPNPSSVRVIELDGPDNTTLHSPHSIRNAWMAVDLMRHWGAEEAAKATEGTKVGTDQWYCIVDDDGFVFTSNAKAMLMAEQDAFFARATAEDVAMGRGNVPLLIGSTHLYRKKKFRRLFVVGGPGIFFNRAALMKVTVPAAMDDCLRRHLYGGGDIRTSFCLMDAGARLVHIEHPYFDSPMRAVGEVAKQAVSPYPVSFHRMRDRMWAYRLGAVEALRRAAAGPSDGIPLVTWGDIQENFMPDNRLFYPSHFFPRQYDNFTWIYFRMTRESLAQYNRKRRRPLGADPM